MHLEKKFSIKNMREKKSGENYDEKMNDSFPGDFRLGAEITQLPLSSDYTAAQ